MARLGYGRYGAQGGDWGAFVSPLESRLRPLTASYNREDRTSAVLV